MEKKLQRNEHEKMLAGVCAGMADYFDVDVTWIRIAFVVATLAGFSGVLLYLILWIVLPVKPYSPNFKQYQADYQVYPENQGGPQASSAKPYQSQRKSNARLIVGLILIFFGGIFLLDEFSLIPVWFDLGKLWPLVFIILGALMIGRAQKKGSYQINQEQPKDKPVDTPNNTTETNTDTTDQTAQ
ncbi:MAG TPA: PspC domain-containing protein [Daejeonella sp.]|nr:PspC domain-containing protein [Daejeonella sp.]